MNNGRSAGRHVDGGHVASCPEHLVTQQSGHRERFVDPGGPRYGTSTACRVALSSHHGLVEDLIDALTPEGPVLTRTG